MELKSYLDVLQRRWRLALVVGVAILALFALASLIMRPDYQAQVMLRVGTPLGGTSSDTNYQTTFATRLMNTYAQVATSEEVMRQLKAELGVNSLPRMNVTLVPDSEILQIVAEGSNAKAAINAANGLAQILAAYKDNSEESDQTGQLDILAKRKTDVEAQLADYQKQYDALTQSYSGTAAKLPLLESALRIKEAAFQNVQTQYEQAAVANLVSASDLTKATKAAATTEMQSVQKELDALRKQYSDVSQSSNAYAQQMTLMRQTIQSTQSAYSNLLAQYDNVSLATLRQTSAQNVVIVSPATEARPASAIGRPFVIGLGLVFGLIVGIVVAFVFDNLGRQVKLGKWIL